MIDGQVLLIMETCLHGITPCENTYDGLAYNDKLQFTKISFRARFRLQPLPVHHC